MADVEQTSLETMMLLRAARASEQKILEALQRRASLANPHDRDAILANPEMIEMPIAQILDGHVVVAEIDDEIVGFAVVLPRADDDAELDGLFVEPARWKQGIARSLVERCVTMARVRGARNMHVIGNPHAKDFYRAVGFSEVGTVQTTFGPALLLILPLFTNA